MHASYWLERWGPGTKQGFHQSKTNSRLEQFWPTLSLPADAPVLVPLCGKSLDMLMLHKAGHPVIGVELSEYAVEAFFAENQLPFERRDTGNLQEFTGTGNAAGIRLFAGDLFKLEVAQTGPLMGFYDRAALIALPPEMRRLYAKKLASLLPSGAPGLLISLIYDPSKMKGPPFSVPDEEVQALYTGDFSVTLIDSSSGPERLGSLAERGLDTMDERVYRMVRT